MNKVRLIVVLGMHRCGTSTITRGLQVMGVKLGTEFLSPKADNNKGFWEDVDINALNIEMLGAIDSDWRGCAVIEPGDVVHLHKEGFFQRAVDLLRLKIGNALVFGFKDPRTAKLILFWQGVFEQCQYDVSYVITIRHPQSVASSLKKRGDMDVTHSYLLWLGHTLTSLKETAGDKRILVDYDRLVSAPKLELDRIAKHFELTIDAKELQDYMSNFVDPKLRHTIFKLKDLSLDSTCPPIVAEIYSTLLGVASDKTSLDSLGNDVAGWFSEVERLKSLLVLLDNYSIALSRREALLIEQDAQLAERVVQLVERDSQSVERDSQLVERDSQLVERDSQLAERDTQLAERDTQLAERDTQLAERDTRLAVLYGSNSWRITWPLRVVSHQLKQARKGIVLLKSVITSKGGLNEVIKKIFRLYRSDGLAGIKRNIRFAVESARALPNSTVGSGVFDRNDYTEWVRRYDSMTDGMRTSMFERIEMFKHKPLISIVMPTYNPKPEWLIEVIESVQQQFYPNWELCIADDASTDKSIRPILERYEKEDSRIKVVYRDKNGHISEASNSALELATGEWVALLDHDDLLPEHALYWVVNAINSNPGVCLIYSDEDKVNEVGDRYAPYFKCDWNQDLFYSHNMFCHFGVYKHSLLTEIGGFRVGLEGAQDYDLALRCIEQVDTDQIHHIPRILYHWRVHVDSTAHSADAKPYAMLAGERAINEHLDRTGVVAGCELIGHGYRVHYSLPDNPPLVSLIIPTRNGLLFLRQCIESIVTKTTYPNYEILIIDNDSDDPDVLDYFITLSADPRIIVHRDERPFNYSQLNNSAVEIAKGEIVGLLNNDVEVISPEWLTEMVSHAIRPEIGAVGAKLWYPDNTLQHGGVVLGIGGWAGHSHKGLSQKQHGYSGRVSLISEFSAVSAACLVIEKSIFKQVGGLNEKNLKIACNDVDFCLKVRNAGYKNLWTPYAELYHHESVSRGYEDTPEKKARFNTELMYMREHWGELLDNDPAYSPNLTLDYEDFSYAWPPRVNNI